MSLLVLLGFIANQLAAIPHAHGEGTSSEHDATPHIHIGLGSHAHDGVCHSHGKRRHSHNHDAQAIALVDEAEQPETTVSNVDQHDADAIYLPAGADATASLKDQLRLSQSLALTLGLPASGISRLQEPFCPVMCLHPPDSDCPGGKLFLVLRNLRI